ncbi:unnamed protein product [Symbiodinium sp. KB8]|nr:unnamed protein product [Symbiodinium sp. KB8]
MSSQLSAVAVGQNETTARQLEQMQGWSVGLVDGSAGGSPTGIAAQSGTGSASCFSHVGSELTQQAIKINRLEHEAAKRTLVVRNFPEWATIEGRELTVARVLQENRLGHIDWDLTTTQMEGSKSVFLAPISILTVPTYAARKKIMEACSRAVVRYWHKNEEEKTPPGRDPDAKPSQAVWEVKMWNWNNPVQMALGITQFERRLGAPMHGLMNAYQPKLQEGDADPKVGDLDLGGQGGSLAGQSALQQEAAQPHRDRPCRDVWYDPLKQHVEHTEIERQAFASASQKTRRPPEPLPHQSSALLRGGLPQDHVDRFFFQDIRPVDELREEMAATKAAAAEESPKEPYHLFDSQDDWDEAVVEAKTSHINRGYDYDISSGLQRRAVEGVDPGTPPQEHGLTGGQGVAGQPAKAFGLKARQALTGLPRFFRDASSQWCSHRGTRDNVGPSDALPNEHSAAANTVDGGAFWNTTGLLEAAKLHSLIQLMRQHKLSWLALTETHMKQPDQFMIEGYTITHSATEIYDSKNKPTQTFTLVSLITAPSFTPILTDLTCIDGRFLHFIIDTVEAPLKIMVIYAPHNHREQPVRDAFWQQLTQHLTSENARRIWWSATSTRWHWMS